jgi:hypothetical protein
MGRLLMMLIKCTVLWFFCETHEIFYGVNHSRLTKRLQKVSKTAPKRLQEKRQLSNSLNQEEDEEEEGSAV